MNPPIAQRRSLRTETLQSVVADPVHVWQLCTTNALYYSLPKLFPLVGYHSTDHESVLDDSPFMNALFLFVQGKEGGFVVRNSSRENMYTLSIW